MDDIQKSSNSGRDSTDSTTSLADEDSLVRHKIDWESCPVVPIGHRSGRYFVLDCDGQAMDFDRKEFNNQYVILDLFGGREAWLKANAPQYDPDTGAIRPGKWSTRSVALLLIRRSRDEGILDENTPFRGRGIWREESHGTGGRGKLIIHVGKAVTIADVPADGTIDVGALDWQRPGLRLSSGVYPAFAPIERPSQRPADAAPGLALEAAAAHWRFSEDPVEHKCLAGLWVGWVGAALTGASFAWRPHLLVRGARGTGKTKLKELAEAALGAQAHPPANDVTAAGLQQWMTGSALALLLDEAEGDRATADKIEAVISMTRLMAGGYGARGRRGSASGVGRGFQVIGQAYLSAINPPVLRAADRSRYLELELAPLPTHAKPELVAHAITAAAAASPALRARAISLIPRFEMDIAVYRTALIRLGADQRQADTYAVLLAGRALLVCDVAGTEEGVNEEIDTLGLGEMLAAVRETDAEESEAMDCLNALFSMPVDIWSGGARETVGSVVEQAMKSTGGGEARDRLPQMGLRLENDKDGAAWLIVACKHKALEALFQKHDARWTSGRWSQALGQLDGVLKGRKTNPRRFAGARSRVIWLPEAYLPIPETETCSNAPVNHVEPDFN